MKSLLSSCSFRRWLGVALIFPLATLNVVWGGVPPITSQSQEVSPVDEAAIDRAVMEATSRIQKLAAADPDEFATILHKAFGRRLNPIVARDLVQKAAHRQLPMPKRILFVPAHVLAGAAAAYAKENGGVLFINAEFRERSAALPDLITHEWGHHLDAILGAGDALGEEGQIFLTGIESSGPILAALQGVLAALESDHTTIEFEGRTMTVECWWNPFKAVANVVKKAATWTAGAVQTVGKATINIGKVVVNNVVDRVKSGVAFVKNTAVAVATTVKGVTQGIASGIALATGNKALSADLAKQCRVSFGDAGTSFKGAGNAVVDNLSAFGKSYNQTTVELNKAVPHLGTALGVAASLTPVGPYIAAGKAVEEVRSAYENGGIKAALTAGAFVGLEVGGSALGRVAKGMKGAKAAKEAAESAKTVADLSKLKSLQHVVPSFADKAKNFAKQGFNKGKGLVDKAKAHTIDGKFTNATAHEVKFGTNLVVNHPNATKFLGYLDKVNTLDKVVRTKDFIPGRDRDKETGQLLGTGGNTWDKRPDQVKDAANRLAAPFAPPPAPTADALVAAKAKAAADAEAAKAKRLADALAAARLKAAADVQAAAKARGATDAQLAAIAKVHADAAKAKAAADAKAQADAKARAADADRAQVAANRKAEADAARAQALTDARVEAAMKDDAEAKAKGDAAARARADALAKSNADAAAKAQAAADAAKAQADAAKGQADADAKAQAAADAKAQADAAKAQAIADAKAQAAADAKALADAAKAQAVADAKAQAIADAKLRADAQAAAAKEQAAADAKLKADAAAKAQVAAAEKAAADATIKAAADAKAQAIADAKELADAQAAALTRTAAEPDDYESRARAAWKAKRAAYDEKEAAAAPAKEKADTAADATTDAETTEADAPEER